MAWGRGQVTLRKQDVPKIFLDCNLSLFMVETQINIGWPTIKSPEDTPFIITLLGAAPRLYGASIFSETLLEVSLSVGMPAKS